MQNNKFWEGSRSHCFLAGGSIVTPTSQRHPQTGLQEISFSRCLTQNELLRECGGSLIESTLLVYFPGMEIMKCIGIRSVNNDVDTTVSNL